MMIRLLSFAFLAMLASPLSAQGINFSASAELTASPDDLAGQVSLTLNADQPIHDALVYARAQGERQVVLEADYWEPGTQLDFELDLPSSHGFPGNYHLLIELAFRDQVGANLAVAMSLQYRFGEEADPPPEPDLLGIDGDRLRWQPAATQAGNVRLTVTTAPSWAMTGTITPPDARIELQPAGSRAAFPNWHYPQLARLDWVQDGSHHSRVFNWTMYTDAGGDWKRSPEPSQPAWWKNPVLLFAISLLVVLAAGFAQWRKTRKAG